VRSMEKELQGDVDLYKDFLSKSALQLNPLTEYVQSRCSWLKITRYDLLGNFGIHKTKIGNCDMNVTKGFRGQT
jgi:hypothetical protein